MSIEHLDSNRFSLIEGPPAGDAKKSFIRRMFADIHKKYDLLNSILSFGQDRRWRRLAVRDVTGDGLTIDLCGAGGQMARELLLNKRFGGSVVIADFSREMLSHCPKTLTSRFIGRYHLVVCDVERLPFRDLSFTNAISAFGLRNLCNLSAFSREVHRVLSGGGQARFLEIGHPESFFISRIFNIYFYAVSPKLARLFTVTTYAYRYLPKSLKVFPPQPDVIGVLSDGWKNGYYRNILGGVAVVYRLEKDTDA